MRGGVGAGDSEGAAAAARVRVEGLREVARLAEVLKATEIELDRRVIEREELVEALAASAAETTAVTEAEAGQETAPSRVPVPGSTVPPWRDGLPVTALAPDCLRIPGVSQQRRSAEGPVKAKETAVAVGLQATPAKVEGVRSRTRRRAERGWLLRETSGMSSVDRRHVAVPDAGHPRDHRPTDHRLAG